MALPQKPNISKGFRPSLSTVKAPRTIEKQSHALLNKMTRKGSIPNLPPCSFRSMIVGSHVDSPKDAQRRRQVRQPRKRKCWSGRFARTQLSLISLSMNFCSTRSLPIMFLRLFYWRSDSLGFASGICSSSRGFASTLSARNFV